MKRMLNNQSGSALAMTLIVMVVLMILGTAFINMSVADNKFASKQEEEMQAYYIARSGAQAVAEYIIKGENSSDIIGEVSDAYSLGGGEFIVDVSYPNPFDKKIVDIKAVGNYKNSTDTVLIRVEGTDPGLGIFSHSLYAFGDITGNMNSADISGTIAAGGSITDKLPKDFDEENAKPGSVSSPLTVKIPSTFDETINIINSNTVLNSSTDHNVKVNSINLPNDRTIEVNGDGVVNLFIMGDVDSTISGDIKITGDTQLHIYVLNNKEFLFKGSFSSGGTLFFYGDKVTLKFQNSAEINLKCILIANTIEGPKNKSNIAYGNKIVFDAIEAIDTSNIGIQYKGYKWLANN